MAPPSLATKGCLGRMKFARKRIHASFPQGSRFLFLHILYLLSHFSLLTAVLFVSLVGLSPCWLLALEGRVMISPIYILFPIIWGCCQNRMSYKCLDVFCVSSDVDLFFLLILRIDHHVPGGSLPGV